MENTKELFEILKELGERKFGLEEDILNEDDILEKISKIDEDRTTGGYIYISDNGISVEGNPPEIMALLSNIVMSLKENGLDEELIKKSVKIGLASKEENEKELKNKLKELLAKIEKEV